MDPAEKVIRTIGEDTFSHQILHTMHMVFLILLTRTEYQKEGKGGMGKIKENEEIKENERRDK